VTPTDGNDIAKKKVKNVTDVQRPALPEETEGEALFFSPETDIRNTIEIKTGDDTI